MNEEKVNLMLQLVMQIAKQTIPKKKFKELCDDYGFWEDDNEFISGEYRDSTKKENR